MKLLQLKKNSRRLAQLLKLNNLLPGKEQKRYSESHRKYSSGGFLVINDYCGARGTALDLIDF
jgi:hypothetical protein